MAGSHVRPAYVSAIERTRGSRAHHSFPHSVDDGNDGLKDIYDAIAEAKKESTKPTIIRLQ